MEWDIQASLQIFKIALFERTVDVFNLNYTSVRKTRKDFTVKHQIVDTMHQVIQTYTNLVVDCNFLELRLIQVACKLI